MPAPEWPWKIDAPLVIGKPDDPSAGAVADPLSPAGARVAPSERASAETPAATTAEQAKAKIEAIIADTSHPWHRGDAAALDEYLALTRLANPDPTPVETAPRVLPDAELPHLTVPADLPPDDARALQELVAYSGVDPAVVQAAIHRVDALLEHPLAGDPDTWAALWDQEGAQAIADARRRLGDRWDETREHVHHAKLMLKEVRPDLYERLVNDPRTANDFQLYMHLAALGAKSRQFFVSRYGTDRNIHT